MQPGDAVIGLASTGVHSNGFTLARKALFGASGYAPEQHVPEFGRSAGEELLEPTRIYVKPVWEMITAGLDVRGLYHITGDGLLNLTRGERPLGFEIDFLPEPQAVFAEIARCGSVPASEMYRVFNMGVGFCIVAPESTVEAIRGVASQHGVDSWVIGRAVADERKRVQLRPLNLVGEDEAFTPAG